MKHTQLIKDGNVMADIEGHDICVGDMPRLLHTYAPCELRYMDGAELIHSIKLERTNKHKSTK